MTQKNSLLQFATIAIILLLVLVPFHAVTVTIIGAHTVFKPILQVWKELLILIIASASFIAYLHNRKLFKFDIINILVISIFILSIMVTLLNHSQTNSILAGIKTNLSVLVLFVAVQAIANYFSLEKLQKIILIPASLVALLAVLQPWIFPPEVLVRLGYSANSIIAGQYIESSRSVIRVFSTLGGPNQLGTYLILPITLCIALAVKQKKWLWLIPTVAFCLPLYMTYSRSAWIGAVVAVLCVLVFSLHKKIQILLTAMVVLIVLISGFTLTKINICSQFPTINSRFIHGDCSSGNLGGSDLQRLDSQKIGFNKVIKQPLGYGLGSAGPASFFSTTPLITENWYLQIAIEVGIIGLALYILLFTFIAIKLYTSSQLYNKNTIMSLTLLSVMIGVAVSSLFLHTLADSTLAILFFALLGIQKARVTK
ncbi:O-antigen ligase family protein [Candidatus Saccharibacteria bacterium]|nr:O-antigen ligase family protein [Candidatus Saccharibacteria bacterium]